MFRDTLHLPVETLENIFVAPVNIENIKAFMNRLAIKEFPNIPQRIDEDYHSIKDDTSLVSVYTTGNVLVRGMLILDVFLTEEIHATDDFKKYEMVFMNVVVPINQPKLVVSTQGTHRSTPRAHRTPTLTISPQGKKMKQPAGESSSPRKSHKITIRKNKQNTTLIPPLGGRDEESYASEFADSMPNDDVDDSDTRIEPESHNENPKNVTNADEEIAKEKKDDDGEKPDDIFMEKDDENDVEKVDEVVKEKDIDVATGSMEFRKEKMQTPVPSPTRSPRKVSSSDKTVSEELTATVSPTTATTSKDSRRGQIRSHIKNKFITHGFFMRKIRQVLDHCNKVVHELTIAKTNEMTKREMPRLVNLVVNKDHEIEPINTQEMISKEFSTHGLKMIEELFRKYMQNTTLNLYPTTSSSTAAKSIVDL
nr:hypothetical protein [Tanacetum cinerariifolium]